MWGIERPDGGRGVGFVGGHYHRNWAVDGFRQIVLNAVVWVAGMDVPEDGVKSEPVSEDQLNENLDVYEGKKNPRITLPDIEKYKKIKPAKWVTGEEHAAANKARIKKRQERRKKEAQKKKEKKQAIKN